MPYPAQRRQRSTVSPPSFPSALEARIKHASIGLLVLLHRRVASDIRQHAPMLRDVGDYGPVLDDIAAAGRDHGRYLRDAGYGLLLLQAIGAATRRMAAETAQVVRMSVAPATQTATAFYSALRVKAEEEMDALPAAAAEAASAWATSGEPMEVLETRMVAVLDRGSAHWYRWLHLMARWFSGAATMETYRNAGVTEIEWMTEQDELVRSAHAALNGVTARLDGPPPLSAALSSNGKDCWPGEDYNCRCQARIVSVQALGPRERTARGRVLAAVHALNDDEPG